MSAIPSRAVTLFVLMLIAVAARAQDPQQEPAPQAHDPAQRQAPDEHAGHTDHGAPPEKEPRTPVPALTDADRLAAFPPTTAHIMADNAIHSLLLIDQLESWDADEGTGLAWEARGWIGIDLDRAWLRTQGEHIDGSTEAADLELLYGRSIAVWWEVVAGLRHDFRPGEQRTFAAVGVQGLAPQRVEIEATAYLGEHGHSALRLSTEYELLLTNRLILQPLLEFDLYGKDDPERGIGSGLSSTEAALRLRYEITRRFAPFLGIVHERTFGHTADLRRGQSQAVSDTRFVIGLRTWF